MTKPDTPLAKAIERSGLSTGQIARRADVAESLLYRYEKGQNTPGLDNSRRIVRALNEAGQNVTLDELWPEEAAA